MIRFSASLVVVGVGLLIAGGVTSKLLLIYIAIGVSALALLFLILGAILHRDELFGREPEGIAAGHDGYADEVAARPEPAVTAAAAPASTAAAQGAERREARPTSVGTATGTPGTPGTPGKTGGAHDTGSQPLHTFAGYEQFTTQAERRRPEPPREDRPSRPSQPSRPARSQPPFVDPQPTRMDWAADLRKAEKLELERQERERQGQPQRPGRADVPAQNRPDRGRPGRSQPGQPFVEPEPTRMDWAQNLRQAEKQELGRQASEREAQPASPGPASPGPGRPQRTPEPAPAEATRAERVQPPADATRAEKIITAEPDGKTPAAAQDQPSAAPASAATPEPAPAEAEDTADDTADDHAGDQADDQAEDKQPAAKASTPPPQEDQPPVADSGAAGQAADQAAEAKSPADRADTADGDTPDPAPAPATSDGDTSRGPVPSDQDVTVVPGVPRFHRSECILIRFMGDNDLQRMPVEQARKAGCTPCRACQPDGEEDD